MNGRLGLADIYLLYISKTELIICRIVQSIVLSETDVNTSLWPRTTVTSTRNAHDIGNSIFTEFYANDK